MMDLEQREVFKQMLLNQLSILMIMRVELDGENPSISTLLDTAINTSKDILKVYFNLSFVGG